MTDDTKPKDCPAYPTPNGQFWGMSLRDRFAEAALISGQASNWRDNDYKPVDGLNTIENTARHAYLIAAAMLKAGEPSNDQ